VVTSFNHSGIVVRDLDEMLRFYTEDLGLTVLERYEMEAGPEGDHAGIPGARRTEVFLGLGDDGHMLELIQYLEPVSSDGHVELNKLGATHVCFLVDDLDKAHQELAGKGVSFVTKPIFSKTPDGDDWGVVYFQDPEGNWLEFIQV